MCGLLHMNKKAKKMLDRILNFTLLISMLSTLSFATNGEVQDVVDNLNSGEGIYGTIGEIIGILFWIGCAVSIIKLMQIGIMFIIGGGSGKNNAKSSLIPWIFGVAICALFGIIGPMIINVIMGSNSGGVFDI